MQKKSLLVALFFGALCLTGCLKNEESASVAQVRIAKAEELKAAAALKNAKAQAEVIYANAEAKLKEAQAALINAQAETEKVRAELLKVQVKLQEVKVDEERVVLQKMQAELEVLLAKAEAQKQFWVNELNKLLAQAEVDAIKNAQKLAEAQADVEAYILKLEGEKADSAKVYAGLYFATLEEIEQLQIEEIKYKAMRALVNQGAMVAREVIYKEIEDNNKEIAKNDAIIAHLKEHQTFTPEQAEAALAEAREELEQAYTAYQQVVDIKDALVETEAEVWNKSADFTFGWPENFVNDLKTILPDYTKYGFDTGYGWVEFSGYYNEEGEFVPLYNREQKIYDYERYPDVEVYAKDGSDFTILGHVGIVPATIFYDNIEEKLTEVKADFAEEQEKIATNAKKNYIDNNYTLSHVDEYIADAEEELTLAKAYIAGHKATIEAAEKKFKDGFAAYNKAQADYEGAWKDFADYMIANYNASRELVMDRYNKEQLYNAAKVKSDKAKETLDAEKAKLAGLEKAYNDAVADEPKKQGAYELAKAEVEGLPEAIADRDTKKGTYETKKAAVAPLKTAMDNAKKEFDLAAEMIVRYPKGTPEYESTYKAQYNTAKTAYDNAVEAYNDAVEAEAKAKTAYDKAEAKVKELSGPVEAALKAWNAAKELIVTTKKAWDDKKADVTAGGTTYEAWNTLNEDTKAKKTALDNAETALKNAIGTKKDATADAKYKAFLDAQEALGKVTAADYDTLWALYTAENPDGFEFGNENNPNWWPRLSWMQANWDVNTTTTYLAVENGEIVEKSIGQWVNGTIQPNTYEFEELQEYWVDDEGEKHYTGYWYWHRNWIYDDDAEPVVNYRWSAAWEVEYYKALKASIESLKQDIDDYYDSVVKANDIVIDQVIANAKAYKPFETSYEEWIDERIEAHENVNEALKDVFDAEQDYQLALAGYEATEAIVNEGMWVYDPNEEIEEAAFHQDGFAWIPINDTIEYFEEQNEKLAFENKFYQNVLTDGKKVLSVVNEIIDQKLQVVSDNIEILATIAAKYRAIMNAYLGIVEGESKDDEDEE